MLLYDGFRMYNLIPNKMRVDYKTLKERWCHLLGAERVSAITEVLVMLDFKNYCLLLLLSLLLLLLLLLCSYGS